MFVRKYSPGEEPELWQLFHETVRLVNIRDYTKEQVRAWAPDQIDPASWCSRIQQNDPYVCVCDGAIVGFADLQKSGYIDQLFVHHAWQRKGVGRQLITRIESDASMQNISTLSANVSITARPLFTAHGFCVVQEQELKIRDVCFTNFLMMKQLRT